MQVPLVGSNGRAGTHSGAHRTDPAELYTMQERIGKGAFGAVYKAIDKRTQQPVAVKVRNHTA